MGSSESYYVNCLIHSLTHLCLREPLEIAVWINDTFDNNLEVKNDFTIYLKEICW